MSSIPTNFGRVSNLLASQVSLANLARTNASIFRTNNELSTGRSVLRPSDDPVRAAAISTLDERLEATEQRLRNLSHADSAMGVIDSTLAGINELILSGKQIAQEQLNFGSSSEEREQQAAVVQSLIDGLLRHANQETVAGFLFGGSAAGQRPVVELLGGYRSRASGSGLVTDLGYGQSIPLSLGENNPLVGTTARVNGTINLNPRLTLDTRIADLGGAQGLGVPTGTIEFAVNGGATRQIDLDDADTIGDVVKRLNAALLQYESDTGEDVIGPAGVSIAGTGLTIDVPAATPPATDPVIEFSDIGTSTVARDLGLADAGALTFTAGSAAGLGLAPHLTMLSPITSLAALAVTPIPGAPVPLGSIRISNGGLTRVVDLSGAESIQDIKVAIEAENLGLRVEIDADTGGLVVVQELASAAGQGLAIMDVNDESVGGQGTATALGIRTFASGTRLDGFNDGRGVQIVTNAKDPVTGLPDPARDVDFAITLGNGMVINIDLRPADVVTVGTLLQAINAQARPQLIAESLPPAAFEARLNPETGGIELWQDTAEAALSGPISVQSKNGSRAALDLGLLDRSYDSGTGALIGEDRAKVRSQNAFTALLDLREALTNNDTVGMGVAGEQIERALDAMTRTRGLFGGYDRRVSDLTQGEEDRQVLDESIRSTLRDTDFAEAATRFSLLQTQLQAGYRVVAQSSQLSLLDFLG